MKSTPKSVAIGLALIGSLQAGALRSSGQQPIEEDLVGVYRPQPEFGRGQVVQVPAEEVKPGLAYSYYNQRLSRRVWGFARGDGSFQYAFGEGTMLPIDSFDLRLSPEATQGLLEEASPGLPQRLAITGASPAVKLTADGAWRLLPTRVSARVFDLETGHRWEWHGDRRVAVLHTLGDQWQVVNGRYRPLGGGWYPGVPGECGTFHRAGSAVYVMRTPEAPR
jgi:hypothetical protein